MTHICIYIIIMKLYQNVKENRLMYEKKEHEKCILKIIDSLFKQNFVFLYYLYLMNVFYIV